MDSSALPAAAGVYVKAKLFISLIVRSIYSLLIRSLLQKQMWARNLINTSLVTMQLYGRFKL